MGQHLYLTQFHLMEDVADKIAKKTWLLHDSLVRVEAIALHLCELQCKTYAFERFDNRGRGFLSVEERTIYVDAGCTRRQYAFEVARQIGHWLLHIYPGHVNGKEPGSPTTLEQILTSTRITGKEEKARARETEACQFASALLVPRSVLISEAQKYKLIDAEALQELSRRFDVSLRMMLYRVRRLAQHLAWEGVGIDSQILYDLEIILDERLSLKIQEDGERSSVVCAGKPVQPQTTFQNPFKNPAEAVQMCLFTKEKLDALAV